MAVLVASPWTKDIGSGVLKPDNIPPRTMELLQIACKDGVSKQENLQKKEPHVLHKGQLIDPH